MIAGTLGESAVPSANAGITFFSCSEPRSIKWFTAQSGVVSGLDLYRVSPCRTLGSHCGALCKCQREPSLSEAPGVSLTSAL